MDKPNSATLQRAEEILTQALMDNGVSEQDARAAAQKLVTIQQSLPEWPPPPNDPGPTISE